jgi:hypothetical protein
MDLLELRVIERILAVVIGGLSIDFGYRLFIKLPEQKDSEGKMTNWKWGTSYFGKGVLRPGASGRELIGTWGYTQADSGAGTWKLRRAD